MYPDALALLTQGACWRSCSKGGCAVFLLSLRPTLFCVLINFSCHPLYSLMCVRAKSGRICVNFFQYIYVSCYSITVATKLTFFLLHSVLKGFYFRPLTSLLVSASHSPLQEERSYFSFKKFYSLCGKDLAPYREPWKEGPRTKWFCISGIFSLPEALLYSWHW